ncbi:uncharacterized protein AMSG_09507 [Thecamonas trahens ATCC 50062]|uniref:Uncharacterized protein n=1 Tax=Thecamonas trahens ATCC 50062 TaxID=461836 RepID=A0A0L0DN99_THETB|nr:hypothetical protein AMSG_09507 [Thecamonas trahens ATCC 50062]KNC53787.1 hypothetical protein AMSG_09507 [Thecamonas trahens ATCC 50062]|eukprot:XP_013754348.1 hypothetical protein AMSG_09507 [Thecamonas trahens ATCC 50062]
MSAVEQLLPGGGMRAKRRRAARAARVADEVRVGPAVSAPTAEAWVPDSRLVALSERATATTELVLKRLEVEEQVLFANGPILPALLVLVPALGALVLAVLASVLASLSLLWPAVGFGVVCSIWVWGWARVLLKMHRTAYVLTSGRIMAVAAGVPGLFGTSATLIGYENVVRVRMTRAGHVAVEVVGSKMLKMLWRQRSARW